MDGYYCDFKAFFNLPCFVVSRKNLLKHHLVQFAMLKFKLTIPIELLSTKPVTSCLRGQCVGPFQLNLACFRSSLKCHSSAPKRKQELTLVREK